MSLKLLWSKDNWRKIGFGLALISLVFTRPADLGVAWFGLAKTNEYFSLVVRLADLAALVIVAAFIVPHIKTLKLTKSSLILAGFGFGLLLFWFLDSLNHLYTLKNGLLSLVAFLAGFQVLLTNRPLWLVVLLPYFCFDHIVFTSPVASVIWLLIAAISWPESTDFKLNLFARPWFLAIFSLACLNLLIAFYQISSGQSLGLSIIGEPILNIVSTNSIAKQFVPFFNQTILRGYGLMPHPNILGLFATFIGLYAVEGLKKRGLGSSAAALGLVSLLLCLLSFSRMSLWAAIVLILSASVAQNKLILQVFSLFSKKKQAGTQLIKKFLAIFLILCGFTLLLSPLFFQNWSKSESDSYRLRQHSYFIQMLQQRPEILILGIGPGKYATELKELGFTNYDWENEPIYNPPTLILAEVGLLGFIWICCYIWGCMHTLTKTKITA